MSEAAHDSSGTWERELAAAEIVVVGPAPPLRGGISAHTARMVEHLRSDGVAAVAASYRRPYPPFLFPGRSLRTDAERPAWCDEILDVIAPSSWARLRRGLARSRATVVLQWWHPVAAPALLTATAGLDSGRMVAICHNALPHERVPAAAAAARAVLGRCSRVLCHSEAEAGVVRDLLGTASCEIVTAPLPCLLPLSAFLGPEPAAAELAAIERQRTDSRIFVAAGHQRLYKGGASLLRAWLLAKRPGHAKLVVVGECYLGGRARREFTELAKSDTSIVVVERYVGDAELVQFLDSAEALVAAHRTASQSGLIPIARALGLPCIVSDAGGLAEQAGTGAVVVAAGDEGALVAAFEARLAPGLPRRSRAVPRGVPRDAAGYGAALDLRFTGEWRCVVEAIRMPGRP